MANLTDDPRHGTHAPQSAHEMTHDAFDDGKETSNTFQKDIDVLPGNAEPYSEEGDVEVGSSQSKLRSWWEKNRRYCKLVVVVTVWMICTAWWIVGLVFHRSDMNWIEPLLLYLVVSFRLLTLYIPAGLFLIPLQFAWKHTAVRAKSHVPERLRVPGAAMITIAVILIGTFVPENVASNSRSNRAISLFGYVVFMVALWLTSRKRSAINWGTVIAAILMQFIIAVFVLRSGAGQSIFSFIAQVAGTLEGFAQSGVAFITTTAVSKLSWFLLTTLPTFIFFIALVQMLYFVGFLQWAIRKFGFVFFWALNLSGVEAIVATANPFLGQGESASLIKAYLPTLTNSEIHQIMTCGFATIAGSLVVVYIGLGANPAAVVSSCVMSIPISIAISKMRSPELEESFNKSSMSLEIAKTTSKEKDVNLLQAMSTGSWTGLKVAGMITANILAIISIVALCDGILHWTLKYLGAPHVTVEKIFGWIFYPVAFLLGVPRDELFLVGQLIGIKTVQNEFVAFYTLTTVEAYKQLSVRSNVIATYAVCGFANIGSIGIQIGVFGQLVPSRRGDFAKNAISACICGALATFMSASLAGALVTTEGQSYVNH